MARLKVYVVPAGFHDAYVAAPSRKAALAAWGSEHDLFARGVAQVVTDPALTAEPLASPGTVVKRSRGTTAEQIAALPDPPPSPARKPAVPAKARKTVVEAPTPRAANKPEPSRDALDRRERALAESEARHRDEQAAFDERQAALDRARAEAAQAWERERSRLAQAIEAARERYDRDMARWRG